MGSQRSDIPLIPSGISILSHCSSLPVCGQWDASGGELEFLPGVKNNSPEVISTLFLCGEREMFLFCTTTPTLWVFLLVTEPFGFLALQLHSSGNFQPTLKTV